MPKIVLQNFGGFDRSYLSKQGGSTLKKYKGTTANNMKAVDGSRDIGYLQAGYGSTILGSGSPITTAITNIDFIAIDGNPAAYGIGNNVIYKIGSSSPSLPFDTIVDNSPDTPTWPKTISGTPSYGANYIHYPHDLIITPLKISSAVKQYLLYAYNTSTPGEGKLGRFNLTDNTLDSDTQYSLSTNDIEDALGNLYVPRVICKSPDDQKIFIGGGYKIDSLSTTLNNATIENNIVPLDPEYQIQSMKYWNDHLVIACQKISFLGLGGQVIIYFWDLESPNVNKVFIIDDARVGAIWGDNDELYVFTSGRGGGKIRRFTGQDFIIEQEVDSNIPRHGALATYRDGFIWSGATQSLSDTTSPIYAYFKPTLEDARELWHITDVPGGVSCLKLLTSNELPIHIAGYNNSSGEYFVRRILSQPSTRVSANYDWPIIELPHRSNITRVAAYFQTINTAAKLNINLATNYSTTFNSHLTIDYANDGAINRKVETKLITDVDAVAIQAEWPENTTNGNTVKLSRIELDYEPNPNASSS